MGQHEQQRIGGSDMTSPDEEYEQVRQSFQLRLRSEQVRLTFLAKELEAVGMHSTSVLGDIEMFAHRLRGAAAVFDAPELSSAAKSLEIAAAIAAVDNGRSGDSGVWSTLRTLTDQLASINAEACRGFAKTRMDPPL